MELPEELVRELEEFADTAIYLLYLTYDLEIQLIQVIQEEITLNVSKYPQREV